MRFQNSQYTPAAASGGRMSAGGDGGRANGADREAPLRVDAQRNLEHVLRAAREVFGELGYGAPMEDVARRARVGVGTVYRRFPSKDVLVRRIAEEETARLTEQARTALGTEDEAWSALARFLRTSAASGAGRLLPPQVLRVPAASGTDPGAATGTSPGAVPGTGGGADSTARVPAQRTRLPLPGEQSGPADHADRADRADRTDRGEPAEHTGRGDHGEDRPHGGLTRQDDRAGQAPAGNGADGPHTAQAPHTPRMTGAAQAPGAPAAAARTDPAEPAGVREPGDGGDGGDGEVAPDSIRTLLDVVGRLVDRARDAGELRPDVSVADVLLVIATAAPALPDAAQQAAVSSRLLDILLNGLRSRPATLEVPGA